MPKYAIAVKRAKRGEITLGRAAEMILDIPEVEIVGDVSQASLLIVASEPAITEVVTRLKGWCHVEPLIRHYSLSET